MRSQVEYEGQMWRKSQQEYKSLSPAIENDVHLLIRFRTFICSFTFWRPPSSLLVFHSFGL
jgi:hypothetical protein